MDYQNYFIIFLFFHLLLYLRNCMSTSKTYIQVILPVRFRDTVTYSVPEELVPEIRIGSRVDVMLGYRKYKGFVEEITHTPRYDTGKIKNIIGIDTEISASPEDIRFWRTISDYYMCSSGEALKAASPFLMELHTKREKSSGLKDSGSKSAHSEPKPVEKGTPGSKTAIFKPEFLKTGCTPATKGEIFLKLIGEQRERGLETLVLTPDIPSCRAMEKLLAPHLPEGLLTYHSGQTPARKRGAVKQLLGMDTSPEGRPPHVIIGLRSALFLPFRNLGLIIVDDEHSPLYKQSEPTPRYHGRDLAIILAQISGARVILASPTPSWETLHNISLHKYLPLPDPSGNCAGTPSNLQIIDFAKELRSGSTKGPLTNIALAALRSAVGEKMKCAILHPKWAFPLEEELWRPEIEEALGDTKVEIYTDIQAIESLKTPPSLIIVLQGEALLSPKNFRSDERAIQQVERLLDITSRSKSAGRVILQTSLYRHNVFRFLAGKTDFESLLNERSTANLPPFCRLIHIIVKDNVSERLEAKGDEIAVTINRLGITDFDGPLPISEDTLLFQLRLPRDKKTLKIKQCLSSALYHLENTIIDVDPY